MKPYFRTALIAQKLDEAGENERPDWLLHEPLVFVSDKFGVITVPAGFVTDFASVPRAPLLYWFAGGIGDASAVIHDYLHRGNREDINHEQAADVYYEALNAEGVPKWRGWWMYQIAKLD